MASPTLTELRTARAILRNERGRQEALPFPNKALVAALRLAEQNFSQRILNLRIDAIDKAQLTLLFDRVAIDRASLPYYPEILDFTLPENTIHEAEEINIYRNAMKGNTNVNQPTSDSNRS